MSTAETDKFVTLIASSTGSQTVRRRVRKDVIQSESSFLKEYIDDGATEIKIPLKRPKNLDLILKYLYEGQLRTSKEIYLESLWNDARILGLVNLQKVCVQRLTDTISLDSWIQRLQFSQAEGCHELESNVLGFVNDNFEDCSSISSFTSLNVDQMIQVLQLPTVKTTVTESNRIVLILDWIKANEVDRCSHAHHVLEQVDLTKLTENSLRLFFDEESALRSWRSVAVFERAIRLKRVEEAARQSVHGHPDESELIEVDPAAFESLGSRRINIKQEVVDVEDSSDTEVNDSTETMNSGGSARECRIRIKREVSPPLPSSVGETIENVDSNQDGPPLQKIPRQEYFQNEIESVVSSPPSQTDFVSKQKQILYFRQLSNGARSLNFVTVSANGAISAPQHLLASLPNYIHGIPKLIWDQEGQNLCFLGYFDRIGHKIPTFNYMSGQGAPKVTVLPRMLHQRHHHQPVLRNGCVYVFGGSKSLIYKNNDRISKAEVLDMTTTALMSDWQWQPIASTSTRRNLYAAACVEGNIYAIGGAVDRQGQHGEPVSTNKAVRYQPDQNAWTTIKPMCNRRCGHALAVLGYNIYVFGGSGKNYNNFSKNCASMKSSEVYNVRQNVWKSIAPMCRPRYGASAVEIEGKIYVIGGDQSNQAESPSSVECYDPESNSWTFVSESVDDLGLFDSITVIDDPEFFLKGC